MKKIATGFVAMLSAGAALADNLDGVDKMICAAKVPATKIGLPAAAGSPRAAGTSSWPNDAALMSLRTEMKLAVDNSSACSCIASRSLRCGRGLGTGTSGSDSMLSRDAPCCTECSGPTDME